MSITEAERQEIYELINQASSDRIANNVMNLFPPVGWADVATKTDIRTVEASLRGEMARVGSRVDRLESRIEVLRSDLLTEMHQSVRHQTWALVAWTTGLAGLIVAFGR